MELNKFLKKQFIILVTCFFFCFKYQYGSSNLHTNVAQEHLRSDNLPETTMIRRESNTGPLVWKTYALLIAPRLLNDFLNILIYVEIIDLIIIFIIIKSMVEIQQKCTYENDSQSFFPGLSTAMKAVLALLPTSLIDVRPSDPLVPVDTANR